MSQLKGPSQTFIEGVLYDFTSAKLGEHFFAYALCRNCKKVKKHHEGDACLFEASSFEPVKEKLDG